MSVCQYFYVALLHFCYHEMAINAKFIEVASVAKIHYQMFGTFQGKQQLICQFSSHKVMTVQTTPTLKPSTETSRPIEHDRCE